MCPTPDIKVVKTLIKIEKISKRRAGCISEGKKRSEVG